jgi:hypothetical protein
MSLRLQQPPFPHHEPWQQGCPVPPQATHWLLPSLHDNPEAVQ